MKKLILAMVFVFATGTMMNANNNLNKELMMLEWDCEEWSNFVFEWEQAAGNSFEGAADKAERAFNQCES